MKAVVFANEKSQRKLYKLTASMNINAELVFNDVLSCMSVGDNGRHEVDDYLVIRADDKSRVLNLLCRAFYGISDTCARSVDERLFYALECMARSGHWSSMGEIESWLMDRDVPFTKQRRVETKK